MEVRLASREVVARDTGAFTFSIDHPFTFEAGQTCDFTIADPLYRDDRGTTRTFSIASSPRDLPSLTIATRLTGSAFKRTLLDCPLGTIVEVDGPYGSFTLHHNTAKPALLLAGGIGITPFRSIVKDATERQLTHRITLLYSNRNRDSSAFLADLGAWSERNRNLTIVPVFTDDTGFIDAAFIQRHGGGLENAIAYVAGPEAFVKAMRPALETAGADPDNVRTEEFPGY